MKERHKMIKGCDIFPAGSIHEVEIVEGVRYKRFPDHAIADFLTSELEPGAIGWLFCKTCENVYEEVKFMETADKCKNCHKRLTSTEDRH